MNLTDLSERLAAQLAPLLPAHSSILIGLSGGVDSVVLLHLLHQLAPCFSWQLSALHVHHGISPNADTWAEFCAGLCATHDVPLHVEYVDIAPLRTHGIEAAARKLRHAAFARQAADFVALAHHTDDQAETLLLQLLRGSGVKGVASMPLLVKREGSPNLLRPLLHCSRREILNYATVQGLSWIEDESNANESYPRNFLRHRMLPLLEEKFPACRDTLARSARHFAEASELLDVLAEQDAQGRFDGATLAAGHLTELDAARAKNLLRWFLYQRGAPMPQAAQLDDMLHQLCEARPDATVCVAYGDWEVHRYQGRVYALHALGEFDRSLVLPWRGEEEMALPQLGCVLGFVHRMGEGMSMKKLAAAQVTIRLRSGSETLRPHPNAATRTLKNLLQEHHVPPWRRERLPLLYCGEELVCVPGVAIAAEYQASAGEAGVLLSLLH
ncbi:MAG TPA: tRNA lysidine(34) synthetase TilS [Gallionella sp.]|nr:tRNA lysidine(34) synthetase TilS [Gallionella sp.]